MMKIYLVPSQKITREYRMIRQGLENHPSVKLVESAAKCDFIFLFYTSLKHHPQLAKTFSPKYTVFIDFHDRPDTVFNVNCLAYFKRSWVAPYNDNGWIKKSARRWPDYFYPINFAIMDEFITEENLERDVTLSCTIRPHRRHPNRPRILEFIRGLKIEGKTQIGELNKGHMDRFNGPDMREYFRLLRRSRIVVTCNPSRWEGDFRTWEALANGALVFVDKMYIPMKHPLIDGKHCIIYDPSDQGLKEMEDQLLYFMEYPEKAEKIARVGHEFAMNRHRSMNRIQEILEAIT